MSSRIFSLGDRVLGEIDRAIKVLASPVHTIREAPAAPGGEPALTESQRLESIRLMRVNHAGEVAAQALYRGQALAARNSLVSDAMRDAAAEEMDHLAWCEERLSELHGRTSFLNPLWYAGSFAIGAMAGAFGDRTSLGFITETERQVESHLHDHLERLPEPDRRSRLILEQMAEDEVRHGATALALGGKELPIALRGAMRLVSRIMTRSSYWL
ncbi:MAG: 2-polyprenyl-3-methyl-6-methoxy-1,4-benzoquinone monooxygenase [Steroidobacteraceae bacterium]